MYTITRNIKILSFSLMTLGILGIAYGFYVAPKTIEESKEIIAASHDDSHGSDSHGSDSHGSDSHGSDSYGSDSHVMSHDEHVFHQLANRPWAALYVAAFFFFMISLGTLAFYAIQRASQAGWSPVLFRVMESITYYLLPGSLIVLLIAVIGDKHIFIWMDPDVVAHDEIIQGKSAWLNKNSFIVRGLITLLVGLYIGILQESFQLPRIKR